MGMEPALLTVANNRHPAWVGQMEYAVWTATGSQISKQADSDYTTEWINDISIDHISISKNSV